MIDVLFEELPTACGRSVGVATLNAPAALNALSLSMVRALTPMLRQWAYDNAIVGVVLQGAGEKAFCAGGDLRELYESLRANPGEPSDYARGFFAEEYQLDYLIHTFDKPILCWGHGIVMGGGIGLMSGASHRVVTSQSRLAMPEITVGLYPDVGGSWLLRRMPGRLGLFLALTGASRNASDALFCGRAYRDLSAGARAEGAAAIQATSCRATRPARTTPSSHVSSLGTRSVTFRDRTCASTSTSSASSWPATISSTSPYASAGSGERTRGCPVPLPRSPRARRRPPRSPSSYGDE